MLLSKVRLKPGTMYYNRTWNKLRERTGTVQQYNRIWGSNQVGVAWPGRRTLELIPEDMLEVVPTEKEVKE